MATATFPATYIRPCDIEECNRASRALCHCCSQDLCIVHLKEHVDILNEQITPILDEIVCLSDKVWQLKDSSVMKKDLEKLLLWKKDAIRVVHNYYMFACRRLKEFVNETLDNQQDTIQRLHALVAEFVGNHDVTKDDIVWITEKVEGIQKQIIKQELVETLVKLRPLVIEKDVIQIDWMLPRMIPFDLGKLSEPHSSKYLHKEFSYDGMASSKDEQYLLLHTDNLLYLYDHELRAEQQMKWEYGYVTEICYAGLLEKFILLTDVGKMRGVYSLCIHKMRVEKIIAGEFCKTACSNMHLYLLKKEQGPCVLYQYKLTNFELSRFLVCAKNESIHSMACNSDMLGLIVFRRVPGVNSFKFRARFEVRSTAGKLDILWSIPMEFGSGIFAYNSISSLNINGWLVTDTADRRLTHISTNGTIQSTLIYKYGYPIKTALLGTDSIVVKSENDHHFQCRRETIINLHKLTNID
ncbi:unnamed protein product [Adineta steineri]|uniref:Uncharacterized protein n=1 Tax=Adineta steineri TaxID=433720 RepID=A0A815AWV3_9BILA|nr:unnamed protein product [Adineta steineri]